MRFDEECIPTRPMIVLRDVEIAYGRRRVLDRVDIEFPTGVHFLVGVNGSGKSSLLSVLTTLRRPSSGEMTWLDQKLDNSSSIRSYRQQVGYVPQKQQPLQRMTVSSFVEYAAWLKGMDRSTVRERAIEVIDLVGLSSYATASPRKLSGGQWQRAVIASAIVSRPQVLALDEPLSEIDQESRSELKQLLIRYRTEPSLTIWATHDPSDMHLMGGTVHLIDDKSISSWQQSDPTERLGDVG